MATAMLENGADVPYPQEILGHARLDTTQMYTKVSIEKLEEITRRPTRRGTSAASERSSARTGA